MHNTILNFPPYAGNYLVMIRLSLWCISGGNSISVFLLTTISFTPFIGIDVTQHDIRFVEDNWESPVICQIHNTRFSISHYIVREGLERGSVCSFE